MSETAPGGTAVADADSRGKTIGLWVLRGLLSLAFLGSGSMKLMGDEQIVENFAHFGYEPGFATFIGVCEVAGAIGVLLPRLTALAASGLSIIMLGAVYNHLAHEPPQQAIPPAVLLVLCAVLVALRREELLAWRS